LIRCAAGHLFADLQVQAIRLPDFRYFFSQLSDALFDGPLHEGRLAEHAAPSVSSPYQCIDLIVSDNACLQQLHGSSG
jgi:hypothetical protein